VLRAELASMRAAPQPVLFPAPFQPPPLPPRLQAALPMQNPFGGCVEVKLKALPLLGREKGQLPYGKWKVDAYAMLDAAHASTVVETGYPDDASVLERQMYRVCNSVVYAALLQSVRDVPVLGDRVRRLQGGRQSGYDAWQAIKSHYVRLSDTNQTFLLRKLQDLEPKDGEFMEQFLNRCFQLRDEFASYGIELDDKLLVTQVFSKLSYQWKKSTGLADSTAESLLWDDVASALQAEDNARRQSNTKAADALLPLGWSKAWQTVGSGKKAVSPQRSRPSSPSSRPTPAARSPSRSPSPARARASSSSRPEAKRKEARGLVCWYCHGEHLWFNCPTKPAAWQPSEADKQRARSKRQEQLGDEADRRRQHSERDKAHAAHVRSLLVSREGESGHSSSC